VEELQVVGEVALDERGSVGLYPDVDGATLR
jgi:hypothetical protein